MDSILNSIKHLIGVNEEEDHFDTDLIMHINSVFANLHQMGVGPKECYSISDDTDLWTDFTDDVNEINNVKTYMYLKVKTLFDPPANSNIQNAMDRQISELEWRMHVYFSNEETQQ